MLLRGLWIFSLAFVVGWTVDSFAKRPSTGKKKQKTEDQTKFESVPNNNMKSNSDSKNAKDDQPFTDRCMAKQILVTKANGDEYCEGEYDPECSRGSYWDQTLSVENAPDTQDRKQLQEYYCKPNRGLQMVPRIVKKDGLNRLQGCPEGTESVGLGYNDDGIVSFACKPPDKKAGISSATDFSGRRRSSTNPAPEKAFEDDDPRTRAKRRAIDRFDHDYDKEGARTVNENGG